MQNMIMLITIAIASIYLGLIHTFILEKGKYSIVLSNFFYLLGFGLLSSYLYLLR